MNDVSYNHLTSRLKPIHWNDFQNREKRKPLIKGILDRGAVSVIYGASNSGKTFFALNLVLAIALGEDWLGYRTKKGSVVYVAAEGGLGISERLEAIRKQKEISENLPPFYIIPKSVDLGSEDSDTQSLISELVKIPDLEMVVIDTLSRALAGADENSAAAMTNFIRNCDSIKELTGAHICLIHHSGKDTTKGARGHSSLRAAVDTEIEIIKSLDNKIITAEVKKQRDGKIPEPFYFYIETVFLGKDEDGDDLTSCILVKTNEKPSKKKTRKDDGLKLYRDIFINCVCDKGQKRIVNSDMSQVLCITQEEYFEALEARDISAAKDQKSKEKTYRRNLEKLILNQSLISMVKSSQTYLWSEDTQPT